jgi:hypothetical protein
MPVMISRLVFVVASCAVLACSSAPSSPGAAALATPSASPGPVEAETGEAPVEADDAEVTCQQFTDKFFTVSYPKLMEQDASGETRVVPEERTPEEEVELRAQLLAVCQEGGDELVPQSFRRCVMKANSEEDVMACKPKG